jgi:hypothetical protein
MNLRHVKEMNNFTQILNQFGMFSPVALVASDVVDEYH